MLLPPSLRFIAKKPLHLKQIFKCKEIVVKGSIDNASDTSDGLMSAEDKAKLDNMYVYNVDENNGLSLEDGNVKIDLATESSAGAMSAEDKTNLEQLLVDVANNISQIKEILSHLDTVDSSITIINTELTSVMGDTEYILETVIPDLQKQIQENAGAFDTTSTEINEITTEINKITVQITNLTEIIEQLSGEIGDIPESDSSYYIKPSADVIYFNSTSLSQTITAQLYKGTEIQTINSRAVTVTWEGTTSSSSRYVEISSDDDKTLTITVKRTTVASRTGRLNIQIMSDTHTESLAIPILSQSTSFLLAQGSISYYDSVTQDSSGKYLDVEDTYAGQLYHYYRTFDDSVLTTRWLAPGRCLIEFPIAWKEYFGTFDQAVVTMDTCLRGFGLNEDARQVIVGTESPGDNVSGAVVSEDCWGAALIYGEIARAENSTTSNVCGLVAQDAPVRYSLWYNSLAGSLRSTALYEREDGSKLESKIVISLKYNLSTDGTSTVPETGTYSPSVTATIVVVDGTDITKTSETVTWGAGFIGWSVNFYIVSAPEGVVSIDSSTGVLTLDASGTGAIKQFTVAVDATKTWLTSGSNDRPTHGTGEFSDYIAEMS